MLLPTHLSKASVDKKIELEGATVCCRFVFWPIGSSVQLSETPITLALLLDPPPSRRRRLRRNSFRTSRPEGSFRKIFNSFLVQTTEEIEISVVDGIGRSSNYSTIEVSFPFWTGRSRAPSIQRLEQELRAVDVEEEEPEVGRGLGFCPNHVSILVEVAPGSDQFHEGIGTSTVEQLDQCLIRSTTRISTPSLVCTRKPTKISLTESPRQDGRNKLRRRRRHRWVPSNTDITPVKPNTDTNSGTVTQKPRIGSYKLNPSLSYPSNTTEGSKQSTSKHPKAAPNEASQQEESNATTLTSIGAVYRRQSKKIRFGEQ
ncbi:hypothetical protein F511_36100 [Dorcoceras hygrometricum]|uniref:Uncharacterized protein n=1 Tax=Dorcoceras hygrometricum TaxID=472368 RepID=A0A2Z7DAQ9_9LAMI|nr:hypothetical protein F511_36100 [Dorcoceras hygrometricum]